MESASRMIEKPIESFFPFNRLQSGSVVVDVGGGKGHNSMRLAHQHPELSFIVQDYGGKGPTTSTNSSEATPHRVQWQQHDYHLEQPVKGADVYLMSNVLMDQQPT
jgi:sterigmatocystin 8-O-methyltransferase